MTTNPEADRVDLFRLLVESVRDYAIFLLDPEGRVASWNVGAERIKGYRSDEIVGRHFSAFYPASDIAAGKCERELAAAAQVGRFEDEGWRLRKGGAQFWANVIITALRDSSGKLVGFAKVTRDLTDQRRAEEERLRLTAAEEQNRAKDAFLAREREARLAVEQARALLATTLRSIGDAVIATDERGDVTRMNRVAEDLTGWPEAEALGRPLRVVFHIINEDTRRVVESPVDRVLREGCVVGLANHTLLVSRRGGETPISDSGAPIRGEADAIAGVVLVFRDATAESRAAKHKTLLADASAALVATRDWKQALTKVAQMAVPRCADWCAVHVVEDGALVPITFAHPDPARLAEAQAFFGMRAPGAGATQAVRRVVETGRPELYPVIDDAVLATFAADEEHLRFLRALRVCSGAIVPLSGSARPLGAMTFAFADSGRHYRTEDFAFAEDLARRAASAIESARVYEAEQRAREAADSANRTKDDFLAMVSHELRTPLNAIFGWARILHGAALTEERRARAVETIERNAVAMTQLIDDLLDVSRIVSGKLRLDVGVVDPVALAAASLEAVRPSAHAKGIEIAQEIDPSVGPLRGDGVRLKQVLWNLLSNAVKFTPAGGKITLCVREAVHALEMEVADTGSGVDPAFLEHVFQPFRQIDGGLSRRKGGLGLGLAIAKQIVELHGGRIEAFSDGVGRGARFVVHLPSELGRSATNGDRPSSSRPTASAPPRLDGVRVLAVDDDEDARALIGEILGASGAQVRLAASAAEAMTALESERPDVLLSDIAMPGETGVDLIRKVRALPPERGGSVPAAALTAHARAEDRRKFLAAGYFMHVPKPIDPSELCSVVSILAGFRPSPREA